MTPEPPRRRFTSPHHPSGHYPRSGVALLVLTLISALAVLLSRWALDGYSTSVSIGLILVPVTGVLIIATLRTSSKPVAVAAAAAGVALFAAQDIILAIPALATSLWIIIQIFGRRAAVAVSVFLTATITVVYITNGESATSILTNTVVNVVSLAFLILLGSVIVELDAALATTAQQATAIAASAEREKDLAVETERTQAARTLHDGLGQQLVAVLLSLDVSTALRQDDPEAADDELRRARTITQDALNHLRRWVRALDPPDVDLPTTTNGLELSIRTLTEAFSTTGLTIRVEQTSTDQAIPPDIATLMLIATREGISNVITHSHNDNVVVTLDTPGDTETPALQLSVADRPTTSAQGTGIEDTPGSPVQPGYGIRSLADRAEVLGGTVTAVRYRDGFRLSVRLPLPATSQTGPQA